MEINEKLLSTIFNVGRLVKEEIRISNCLLDFTQTEVEILKFLHVKKNTAMRAVANYLHIKPSSVTPVIESLVKKNCLKRVKNKDDRRVIYIRLTSKGSKSLQKKYKNVHKTIQKVFGGLNNKDKQKLINIFEKIHANNI